MCEGSLKSKRIDDAYLDNESGTRWRSVMKTTSRLQDGLGVVLQVERYVMNLCGPGIKTIGASDD